MNHVDKGFKSYQYYEFNYIKVGCLLVFIYDIFHRILPVMARKCLRKKRGRKRRKMLHLSQKSQKRPKRTTFVFGVNLNSKMIKDRKMKFLKKKMLHQEAFQICLTLVQVRWKDIINFLKISFFRATVRS